MNTSGVVGETVETADTLETRRSFSISLPMKAATLSEVTDVTLDSDINCA